MTDRGGRLPEEDLGGDDVEVQEPEWDSLQRANAIQQTQQGWGFQSQSQFTPRVDAMAEQYREEFGKYPTSYELTSWDQYQTAMTTLANGWTFLPPIFSVDGTTVYNDPFQGPQVFNSNMLDPFEAELMARQAGVDISQVPQGFDVVTRNNWTGEQLQQILASVSPVRARGGGSGGSRRSPTVFDRAQLLEAAQDRWRGLMLETPESIEGHVDQYMKDANSFWMSKGGQLDFDTYIVNKMRGTARYKTLYGKKPGFQSEEEYMAQYRPVVAQFGINPRATQREVEAGLESGAGAAGVSERVGRVREVQNQAGFSQRMAQTVAGLGSIVRS